MNLIRYSLNEFRCVRSNIISKLSLEELVFLLEVNEFGECVVKLSLFGNYISNEGV